MFEKLNNPFPMRKNYLILNLIDPEIKYFDSVGFPLDFHHHFMVAINYQIEGS